MKSIVLAILASLMVSAAAALPLGGSVPPPSIDIMASLVASLPSNPPQWSSELIAAAQAADPSGTHHHFADNIPISGSGPAYEAAYCHAGCTNLPSSGQPWAFSSGVAIPDQDLYITPGIGGHANWPGTEVQVFNARTVTWTLTDTSAQYDQTGATVGAGGCPQIPWQSNDPNGWRIWCNSNGRFAGDGRHTAGMSAYSKSKGLVYTEGYAQWQGSNPVQGITAVVVSSGLYQDPPTVARTVTGQTRFSDTNGFADVITTVQCSGCNSEQMFMHGVTNAGGPGNNVLIDMTTGTVSGVGGQGSGLGDSCGGMGTIIPDPINGAPFLAYINTAYSSCSVADTTHMTIQPKINVIPNGTNFWVIQATSNAMPDTCGIDGNEMWLYMGNPDFGLTGNRQVVGFSESCTSELKILDVSTVNPTWSTSVSIGGMQPPAEPANGATTKKFWFDPVHHLFLYFSTGDSGSVRGFRCPPQVTGC